MTLRRVALLLVLLSLAVPMFGGPVRVPPASPEAERLYRTSHVVWTIARVLEIGIPLALFFSGMSTKMRALAARASQRWYVIAILFGLLYVGVTFVLDLPFAFYASYLRPHAYGLSNQTLLKWSTDALIGLAVSFVTTSSVIWIPYLLIRRSPRRWWLYGAMLIVPLIAVVLLITPVFFDPLFNDFHAMRDKKLESKILSLASRAGIDGARVFEVDKSVDTKTVNAYVTGFWKTKRIVLWDTAIARLSERELLSVMGHEMGHFVLRHVSQFVIVGALVALLGLRFVDAGTRAVLRRSGTRVGVTELEDPAALPLALALFATFWLLISPAINALTRHNEHEADRFSLEITHDNEACATSFVRLQHDNLSVPQPGPVYTILRASHPSLASRVDFCNSYRPWDRGEPLRYRELIRDQSPSAR